MKIKNVSVREIFDSREESTLEIALESENSLVSRAQIPSGKSRGKNEAAVLAYPEARKACVRLLKKNLLKKDFNSVQKLDKFLCALDGTENKKKIGGNVILGVSIAFTELLAAQRKKEVWEVVREEFFGNGPVKNPLIFSNLINGGAHADNNLDIQEYMVVARVRALKRGIKKLISLYRDLGEILRKKYKIKNLALGDEGGYSLNFKNNFEPIRILGRLIYKHKLPKEFMIGLDAAATNFYKNKEYNFEGRKISGGELKRVYKIYFKKSKLLFSIEDPFAEDDIEGFKMLIGIKDKLIVGDDLTTTNPSRITYFSEEKLINAVIIKPNQIGTVSETCTAIKAAMANNVKTIVSHRSGETEDNFIIHLARASGAYGVKIGAPIRERIFKFDELMRIYAR